MAEELPSLPPVKRNRKGQMVRKRQRHLIINLYKDLMVEDPRISKKDAYHTLSKKTGYGIFSIKKTLLQYERTGTIVSPNRKKQRIAANQLVEEFDRCMIRRKIHTFFSNKELPTLAKVLQAVNNDEDLPNFKRTNFWKLLKELNFTYVSHKRNSILTERDDIIVWRRNYLRDIRRFREEGRPIYYLDETWVNAGDVNLKVWLDTKVKSKKDALLKELSKATRNPSVNNERLIVLHIGSTAGFVPGGLLCFESKKKSANYHDEMDSDTFLEWFERILPLLEENAVIVMDNAPYHSVKSEGFPDCSWRKAAIISWLQNKGEAVDISQLRAELLNTVSLVKGNFKKYIIDEKAREHNKTVLRLPPYHCEFNPMEMAWSMVKGYIKSRNTTFEIDDVKRLLEEGIEQVTSESWSNFVKRVIEDETKMWDIDEIADQMIDGTQPIIIGVNADSDSDSEC